MKLFLLKPFDSDGLNNHIFDSPYGILRDLLVSKKINLQTYDKAQLEDANQVLFFNYDEKFYRECLTAGLSKNNLVLFTFEPKVVEPNQYNQVIWQQFHKVFVHSDELLDGRRFFKLRYPMGKPPFKKVPNYNERKFLTLINANKYSYVSNELYSYRRKAIRYFEKYPDFDLYGYQWELTNKAINRADYVSAVKAGKIWQLGKDLIDRKPYKAYQGSVKDKYETLKQYKFCLCFENELNATGYITEKIFDALISGAVPIYLGAPDIEKSVPKNCFIDMREFDNFSDLRNHLLKMTREEFDSMQIAGQKFLQSNAFKIWQPEAVFKSFVKDLLT